jgi:uncharacterized protein
MRTLCIFIFCFLCFYRSEAAIIPITLDYAQTDEEVTRGLMYTSSLAPDHGLLFSFPSPMKLSFWMYNTWIDLSIAFLDEHQVIREIYELKSYPEITDPSFFAKHSVSSTSAAQYALEMNKQWFENHQVKPGDRVFWDPISREGYIDTNH